jgi:8-oxo-dGTP diphosphatase
MELTSTDSSIKVVTLIHISERRILLIRSRSNPGFYFPGGKPEKNESDIEALAREIQEELGCQIDTASASFFNRYVAQAYEKPAGIMVCVYAYRATLAGIPRASSEVTEIRYFTSEAYQQMSERAPAAELTIHDLKQRQLID